MEDFVRNLGCLGFTVRLKRLSDAMIHDGRKLYKELDLDIEPNWYLVFRLLKKHETLTVMEIADKIKMAHPSVIAIVNKMFKAGYITSETSKNDNRKREISLTDKAHKMLPEFEKVWEAGEKGVIRAIENTNTMEMISFLEKVFFEKGFKERTLEELKT